MDRPAADRTVFWLIAALLLVAFVAGGDGIGSPRANLAVQLAALVVLALRFDGLGAFLRESPLALRALITASLALPLLQIVPLPEAVWSALPGRALVARSLEQVGTAEWMTFSLDPRRTLLALTALVTPLAVLIGGWTLPRDRLLTLGWCVAALGIVTVLIGLLQVGAGDPERTENTGRILLGTFANRNSTALFLGFTLGLAALLPAPRPHPALLAARLAVCAMLLIAIVMTQSRTGVVLAVLPALLGAAHGLAMLLRGGKVPAAARAAMIGLGALALVGTAAGTLIVAAPGRTGETFERFQTRDDPRRFIWDDAAFTAGRYWPAGAGMGTFDEIYQVDESLENLTGRRAGRAHNDYIELTIEAGAPGLALAFLWAVLIGWLSWRARHSSLRWAAWAGSTFLLAIALQSITDYPLRNQTILAFAGFALLLLVRIASERRRASA